MHVRKIIKNEYVYSVIARLMTVGIGVLHSIAFARFLGPELRGMAATVQSYSGILSIILTFGMQEAYPYYKRHQKQENFRDAFITLNILLFVINEIVGIFIALVTEGILSVTGMIAVLSPWISFSTVTAYVLLIEKPIKQNKAVVVISILETIFCFILLVSADSNAVWLLLLLGFSYVVKGVYCTCSLNFKFVVKRLNVDFVLGMLKFGFWPMLGLLLTGLNYKIDVIMLSAYKSISLADIGIYSIGVSLADKTVYIPDAVREILLSKLAKGAEDEEVARAIRMCLPVGLFMTLLLITFGRPVIDLMYGKAYYNAYDITVICVFGTAVMIIFKMISQWNVVHKKQMINTIMLSISVISNVIMNLLFIPYFGILGAAYASVIGYLICAIIFLIYFSSKTGISLKNILFVTKNDMALLRNKFK